MKLVPVQRYCPVRNQRNSVIPDTHRIISCHDDRCDLIMSYHDLRDQNCQIVGCQSALFGGGRIRDWWCRSWWTTLVQQWNNVGAGQQRCIITWSWFQCSVTALRRINVTASFQYSSYHDDRCDLIMSYHDLRDQNCQIVGCQSALFGGGRILDWWCRSWWTTLVQQWNNVGAGEQRCIITWSWFQCSVTALWGINEHRHPNIHRIIKLSRW